MRGGDPAFLAPFLRHLLGDVDHEAGRTATDDDLIAAAADAYRWAQGLRRRLRGRPPEPEGTSTSAR